MKLAEMNDLQSDAVDTFESAGGAIEFYLIDKNGAKECKETYREAAILGLKAAKRKNDEYFEKLLRLPDYQNRSRSEFFDISIKKEKVDGHEISLREFMGNSFNLDRKNLALRGKTSAHLNDYFWVGDNEVEENAIKYLDFHTSDTSGYSDAFVEPPYNLSGSHKQINKMFWDISNSLFNGFLTKSSIWSWSTDCSNYFDAGKEWWGTYFYTYSLVDTDNIVVLLASTTD